MRVSSDVDLSDAETVKGEEAIVDALRVNNFKVLVYEFRGKEGCFESNGLRSLAPETLAAND